MIYACNAQRIIETGMWSRTMGLPSFTVEASSLQEAESKAKDIVWKDIDEISGISSDIDVAELSS